MKNSRSLTGGIALIIIGSLLLMLQFLPERFTEVLDLSRQWPLILIGIGALRLVSALRGRPAEAVGASVLTGIGGLLYYQSLSGNWESWSYAWTLILVFVGLGRILAGLLDKRRQTALREGRRLVVIGLLGFLLFGSLFGGLALSGDLIWPLALIGGGTWLLLRNWRRA